MVDFEIYKNYLIEELKNFRMFLLSSWSNFVQMIGDFDKKLKNDIEKFHKEEIENKNDN